MNIEQFKRLHEAATKEPWESSHNIDPPGDENWSAENKLREGRGEGPNHIGTWAEVYAAATADAALIVFLRNSAPSIIAALEERDGWKRDNDRLLQSANSLQEKADESGAWRAILSRIEKRFGCGHTNQGPGDAEAIVRHVDEALEERDRLRDALKFIKQTIHHEPMCGVGGWCVCEGGRIEDIVDAALAGKARP